ncbi:MAG: DUF429 domain-containing protein [Lautropia sp.]
MLTGVDRLASIDAFGAWLRAHPRFVAGCDFPFGLPRAFVAAQGWACGGEPCVWPAMVRRAAALSRAELVDRCRAFVAPRPAGARFAHRRTDGPAGSSPSMKWVNPPVVLMFHAGAPVLLEAGVDLPCLNAGDPMRVALEAYPGMLARDVLGRRSYKADDRRRDDAARRTNRRALVEALVLGRHRSGIALAIDDASAEAMIAESSADTLDAAICAVQAAWGWQRRARRHGLPHDVDPCEGWIVGAPEGAPAARAGVA